ncbi:MAG: hypothetical protein NVS1B1_06880 [Candidatus Limnocylindrales bacterium]
MDIGLGLDSRLSLSAADQRDIAAEAADLGYQSLWTPNSAAKDVFDRCDAWYAASGLATGISVLPRQTWSIDELAAGGAGLARRTGGTFVLGVGSGTDQTRPIGLMRETIDALRERLDTTVPVYLGALGPQMLRLAGQRYDGAALNWSDPERVAQSRAEVARGAASAGRDAAEVRIHQYIRVCVDDDVPAARTALAKMVLSYALARPGADPKKGYRGNFARMGFDAALSSIERARDQGADADAQAAALPDTLLAKVGYWGAPAGARAAFARLAEGLDTAVVRVVAATRSDADGVRLAMRACAPVPGKTA